MRLHPGRVTPPVAATHLNILRIRTAHRSSRDCRWISRVTFGPNMQATSDHRGRVTTRRHKPKLPLHIPPDRTRTCTLPPKLPTACLRPFRSRRSGDIGRPPTPGDICFGSDLINSFHVTLEATLLSSPCASNSSPPSLGIGSHCPLQLTAQGRSHYPSARPSTARHASIQVNTIN